MPLSSVDRSLWVKDPFLELTESIFGWACDRGITLSAAHVRGVDNVDADRASRVQNVSSEWMLLPHLFTQLCHIFMSPCIDLFATRINAQMSPYVSWRPDPDALFTDAFTIDWNFHLCYAFLPFSVIGRVLQKIQEDGATAIVIVPLWPTRVWFPRALQLLAAGPLLLPRDCLVLPQDPSLRHPMTSKMPMAAMLLSGDASKTGTFRRTLPPSSCHPGGLDPDVNIGVISSVGCSFVSGGRLIHFDHL